MPQHDTSPAGVLQKDASESWDDDFEFQSNPPSRSSIIDRQAPPSSTLPPHAPEEEIWDDAYEDEDAPNYATTQPPTSSAPHAKPDTDEEMENWGSGSEWSGDGDAEDVSHESYTRATSQPPERSSSSSVSHSSQPSARFPTLSHSPFPSSKPTPTATSAAARSPTSPSFFARMSPVKKWKARDSKAGAGADATPKTTTGAKKPRAGTEKKGAVGVELAQNAKSASKWVKRRESKTQVDAGSGSQRKATSPLKRVFSGANSASKPSPQGPVFPTSVSTSQPTTPVTPDLTFSSLSPASIPSTSPVPHTTALSIITTKLGPPPAPSSSFRSKTNVRPSTALPTLAPAPSMPLVSSSAHNLPLPLPSSDPLLTPRRSSLSDLKRPQLKIPERISRAQRDIKRDMGDVKEFAACVEQLKNLQHVYAIMLRDLRATLTDTNPSPSPSPSSALSPLAPTLLPIPLPRPRRPSFSPKKRRDTLATASPQSSPTKPTKRKFSLAATPPPAPSRYATALDRLDAEYGAWWECAEVLIALGSTGGEDAGDGERADVEGLGMGLAAGMTRGRRPRAVTLGSDASGSGVSGATGKPTAVGPPLASPPRPAQWRATTGRAGGRDLTPRQLVLLKAMLRVQAGAGWDPRAADAGRGELARVGVDDGSVRGKGKGAAGAGRGIRDLWKGLKRGSGAVSGSGSGGTGGSGSGEPLPRGSSSCDSSSESASPAIVNPGMLTFKSTGAGTGTRTPSPSKRTVTAADTTVLSRRKQPLRRPSLAGIFGIGQKVAKADADATAARDESSSDWDRMDMDVDVGTAKGTVRGTKRLKAQSVLVGSSKPTTTLRVRARDPESSPDKPALQPPRSPRLFISFSDDLAGVPSLSSGAAPDSTRTRLLSNTHLDTAPEGVVSLKRLALTPENIRPLLGHARDVGARLNECIGEVRGMMGGMSVV